MVDSAHGGIVPPVPLLGIPNVSEGRDGALIARFSSVISKTGVAVLDIHSDLTHQRTVFTTTGEPSALVEGMTALADACRSIDLRHHDGVHPRLGGLDVCPIVPLRDEMTAATDVARQIATAIGELGLPVFLYGEAARREETRDLPSLRRGGLDALVERIQSGLVPDAGPVEIDAATGVVCVGARGPLIAFNVVLDATLEDARAIVPEIRVPGAILALALPSPAGAQVSMNLVDPGRLGIDQVFARVSSAAGARGVSVVSTEIVGLPEARFLPDPDAQAARLLIEPGRSVETALAT